MTPERLLGIIGLVIVVVILAVVLLKFAGAAW